MKNKFPGRLLFLAVLVLGSCSDGGDGIHEVPLPALPAAWRNLFRTPTSSNLRGVRFVNANQGYVVGDSTSIFRTENGAAATVSNIRWYHHEPQPASRQADLVATDILLGSAQAVGNDATGGKYWNSPGALDWYTSDTPGSGSPMTDVDVVQSDIYGGSAASFYLRQNGDVAANGVSAVPLNSGVANAQGIDFVGLTGKGYISGANGSGNAVIRHCINFGQSVSDWSTMPFEPTSTVHTGVTLNAIQIVGGTATIPNMVVGQPAVLVPVETGFAAGSNGTLLVMHEILLTPTTSERRWKQQALPVSTTLRGVHFPQDYKVGWVVGNAGTLLKLTWIPPADPLLPPDPTLFNYTVAIQSIATTIDFYDLWFTDLNTGYVVGDAGTVYRTLDGGTTWTLISGGSLNHLNAVDFSVDGSRGIAVGEGGVLAGVARTLDGGESWTTSNSGLGGTVFYGVSIPKVGGTNTAFVCGDGGVFRCADITAPTLTWNIMALPAGTYRQVNFGAGPSMGVCVGDTLGAVYSTANGDALLAASVVWTPGTGLPAASFACVASDSGGYTYYVGGTGGALYSSTPATLPVWTAVVATVPVASDIRSLQAPGGGFTVVAAFANNTVQRLVTAGPTWLASGAYTGTAVSIGFADAANGWLVTQGAGKGLFRTINGGTTWTPQVIHTKSTLRFAWAAVLIPNLAVACGENGTLLKTIVGGN